MTDSTLLLPARTVRRGLLAAKGFYFVLFAALGAMGPFFNLFLQQRGLTGAEIGLLATVPALLAMGAGPFWGALSDRWQLQRFVLWLCAFGAGASSLFFLRAGSFGALMAVVVVVALFRNPLPALLDGAVMGLLPHSGESFGGQRAWGSIGFVAASYVLGLLVVSTQAGGLDAIFWAHALLLGVFGAALSLLLPPARRREPVHLARGLGRLLRLRAYRGLIGLMLFFGMGMAAYINFLSLHIVGLGGSARQAGLAFALAGLCEIPVMLLGHRRPARLSYAHTLTIGMIGFAAGWALLGAAQQPWQVIAVIPLVGVCSGLVWMSIAPYADAAAPDGLRASAQALAQAVQGGPGWALGATLAGLLWDAAGGGWVFAAAALCAAAGAALFARGAKGK